MTARAFELPRVKVCGLTHGQDVRLAVDAGARACGFVHHAPSPRSVAPDELVRLARELPAHVLGVLVLVDGTPARALELARTAGLACVQLCGAESPAEWRDFPLPLLRRVPVDGHGHDELLRWRGLASGFVLDHPSTPGGSGRAVDLQRARELARLAPCLLAGGLDEQCVAERLRASGAAGADASSRLEHATGRKDPTRTRAFVRAALDAFSTTP